MQPRLSVAQVLSSDGLFLGTGFFTSLETILTCEHVIKDSSVKNSHEFLVRWQGEDRLAELSKLGLKDSAVLRLKHQFSLAPNILRWAAFTPAEGRKIEVLGFNKPEIYQIETLVRYIRGYAPKYDLCVLDRPVLNGFSGSPACIDDLVVGMVVASHEDRTLLIPVTALSDLRPNDRDFTPLPEFIIDVGSITPMREWCESPAVRFTVTNTGSSQIKIPYINLVVKDRKSLLIPHHALPGAIVEEYLLKAHLTHDRDLYELLEAPHVLSSGETDGFRLRITSEDGWTYTLCIEIGIKSLGTGTTKNEVIGPFTLDFPILGIDTLLAVVRQRLKET
jgi:hypothetical protein